jgi:hypothetical protein
LQTQKEKIAHGLVEIVFFVITEDLDEPKELLAQGKRILHKKKGLEHRNRPFSRGCDFCPTTRRRHFFRQSKNLPVSYLRRGELSAATKK